jgi:two-component system chemotaxis response regulator CheB
VASSRIRVLIVDDSSIQRQLLREALSTEPDIEVISHAANGRLALPRVKHLGPDIVVLDQEMPEMNGIETLQEIRKESPQTGVIMYCARGADSARITLRALELGAFDFVRKPEGETDPIEYIRSVLVPRIRAFAVPVQAAAAAAKPPAPPLILQKKFDVCAIGISTGGPTALRELIPAIPKLRGSILIVQHMPPVFTAQLADSLSQLGPMPAVEVSGRMPLEGGKIYIAAGGHHMTMEPATGGLELVRDEGPAEMNCKPSVNVLFRSIAKTMEQRSLNVIGVVMTGMGYDGYDGMKALRLRKAHLIAQSRESCLVYGMPSKPTEDGIVDESLDIAGIARRIREGLS